MNRKNLSHLLEETALTMELAGSNQFKARAYANAARTILKAGLSDADLADRDKLKALKGIGPAIAESVVEAVTTGRISVLEELKQDLPPGLSDLVKVPGLGVKKARLLYDKLGLTSLGELAYACHENRLVEFPGFGPKTQARILEGLEYLKRYQDWFLYPDVAGPARQAAEYLARSEHVMAAVPAGKLRRRREIVDRALIVVASQAPGAVLAHFSSWIKGVELEHPEENRARILHPSGPMVEVEVFSPEVFGQALVWATGSRTHLEGLRERARTRGLELRPDGLFDQGQRLVTPGEESFYQYLSLPLIPPELREGRDEIEAAAAGDLPRLVRREELKGLFHVHTTASDGGYSLLEMAQATQERGLSYLGLSDHSKSAFYAGGLKEDDLVRQAGDVSQTNARLKGFRVFHGIESDILSNGSLDYPDQVLDRLDFVIASIHSNFNLDRETQTARLVKAVEHPATTILGHPTGRLLLARKAYEFDWESVIKACARNRVALEINSNPHRLDTDWRILKEARAMGIRFVLGPDAHSIEGLDDLDLGLGIARKGWLGPEDLLNTLDVQEMTAYLQNKKDFRP